MTRRRASRALKLLECVLAKGVAPERVCEVLRLDPQALDRVRTGEIPLPIVQQALLAALAEADLPALRRQVANLRGEIAARIAFDEHQTALHSLGPVSPYWGPAGRHPPPPRRNG